MKGYMIDTEKLLATLEEIKKLLLEIRDQQDVKIQSVDPDFETLKRELFSDRWPPAVPSELLCNAASEQDKADRASNILSMFVPHSTQNMKFLDFGCGEGHVAKEAAIRKTSLSVGFDINKQGVMAWEEKNDNLLLTTDFNKVKELGPYDIILMYDVLDHCDKPVDALKQVRELFRPETTAYVRCHPWCSRHGGHLYNNKLNKAWVQLVFTEEEMSEMNHPLPELQKILFPIKTYKNWFQKAELKPTDEPQIKRCGIEPFFKNNPVVADRIKKRFDTKDFPEFQMSQEFLDFTLKI